MNYRKPSKFRANETYLRNNGILINANPYSTKKIDQKKLYLIICEGENTEPCYFEGFPIPSKVVEIEGGCGSKTALVKYAIKQKVKKENIDREIWCVFDFDIKFDEKKTQPKDFNNAIKLAEANGICTAWSNDAFELWFLLHYQELDTAITRHEIFEILKDKWSLQSFSKTAKTKVFCQGHYERHSGIYNSSQKLAIRRAKKLHKSYGNRKDYAKQCPCTTVYLLVEELNKNIKK